MHPLLFAYATAIPATNLNIIPLDENHPAVAHYSTAVDSFASSPSVQNDIAQLERFLGTPFEKNWTKLARKSEVTKIPWDGDYWPTYKDGINQRWAGENSLSPVEKYAQAFGVNAQRLADAVSRKSGVLSQSFLPQCNASTTCEAGAECAIRRGQTQGRCIPTWFGICHAWAPVSIIEKEPKCAVTFNNVTFEPMDMKALITQIYDSARIGTVFTGKRCNEEKPTLDVNGRIESEECRDVSPEFFHLVTTNFIGVHKRSFVADVYHNAEVWNHPARSYDIIVQRKITAEEAMTRYFPKMNTTTYTFNPAAKQLLLVRTRFSYIVESTENISGQADRYTTSRFYDYLLELDENENIIGGEWIGRSKQDHMDFIYKLVGPPAQNAVVLGAIRYSEVKNLIELSQTSCPK
jgi:hypothetical protein